MAIGGGWRPPSIFYIDLLLTGSLLVLMSCYFGNLEATFTRQLLVVKGWLLGEAGGHLTNNTITNILNFIYQWLGNCWCWRGDYPERPEATLQYTKFHLSMARQLLMLKMTIEGAWRPPYNILNFIHYSLGNCWWWRGGFWVSLEATLQYSKFHLSLTGQLLMVKVSMPMFSYTYLYIYIYTNSNE